jgi:hypothetical protein
LGATVWGGVNACGRNVSFGQLRTCRRMGSVSAMCQQRTHAVQQNGIAIRSLRSASESSVGRSATPSTLAVFRLMTCYRLHHGWSAGLTLSSIRPGVHTELTTICIGSADAVTHEAASSRQIRESEPHDKRPRRYPQEPAWLCRSVAHMTGWAYAASCSDPEVLTEVYNQFWGSGLRSSRFALEGGYRPEVPS